MSSRYGLPAYSPQTPEFFYSLTCLVTTPTRGIGVSIAPTGPKIFLTTPIGIIVVSMTCVESVTDMHTTGAIPRALAAVERVPAVVERVRAARQPGAGRGAGPGRSGRATRAAHETQRCHARVSRRAARARAASPGRHYSR